MKSNASNSTTIEMKVPLMMTGDFDPHFSVKNMLKDVRIGAKLARDFALDLPVTEICRDMLLNELKQGRGDADYASIAQKYLAASAKTPNPKEEALTEQEPPAWIVPAEVKPAAPPPSCRRRPRPGR